MLLTGLALRLPTFGRTLLSSDEAAYATMAEAMQRGAVLYQGAVDHKPPAIHLTYAFAVLIFGYGRFAVFALGILPALESAHALARAACALILRKQPDLNHHINITIGQSRPL